MKLESFDMLDRVEEVDVELGTIRAIARLPDTSPVFDGHFPGFPTLPGVMMLEMINHAAGYILVRRWKATKFIFLGAVKRAKFRRFLRPGVDAVITANFTHDGSGYAVAEGAVTVDGEVVADAEITMLIGDFPDPELRRAFEDLLRRVPVGLAAPAHA
jgi:3-hydroxyacyl-[acyl-carrier-protein] dehydratase